MANLYLIILNQLLNYGAFRFIFGLLVLIPVFIFMIKWRFPEEWKVFRLKYHLRNPFRPNKKVIDLAKKELEDSKKHNYATLDEFLQDCPKYQIKEDWVNSTMRSLYSNVGVEFRQFVFIRKNNPNDVTAWLRISPDQKSLVHNKGQFVLPLKSVKNINYYSIDDMRPLIDLTDELDWRNPDAVADVVAGLTNTNDMNNIRGDDKQASKYALYILIGIVLIIIIVSMLFLNQSSTQEQTITKLNQIAELINQTG